MVVGEADKGSTGEAEKQWMWCFLIDHRALGIKTDVWLIAAQEADEWYKTVKHGAEREGTVII